MKKVWLSVEEAERLLLAARGPAAPTFPEAHLRAFLRRTDAAVHAILTNPAYRTSDPTLPLPVAPIAGADTPLLTPASAPTIPDLGAAGAAPPLADNCRSVERAAD